MATIEGLAGRSSGRAITTDDDARPFPSDWRKLSPNPCLTESVSP